MDVIKIEDKIILRVYNDDDDNNDNAKKNQLIKLNYDMQILTEISKDLDMLILPSDRECVSIQKEPFDSVEKNITVTKEEIKQTEKEIEQESKYQNKTTLLKAGIIGLLATGVGIPLGIFVSIKVAMGVIGGVGLTYVFIR